MSLASFAVRICTVEALRGQTFAGDSIEDSPIDPIALAVTAASPVIAVFSDGEALQPAGTSFLASRDDGRGHTVDLTMHVFLPTDPVIRVDGQAPIALEGRESGAAVAVDLIHRQIERALGLNDGVWADLWRRAVIGIVSIEAKAYVLQTDKGVRLPAREILLRLDVLDSPEFGDGASDFWPDFVAAMEGSDDLAPLAAVVAGAIRGDALPSWRDTQALLGLRDRDMQAIGLGPIGGTQADDVVPMASAALDDTAEGAPDPVYSVTSSGTP